MATFDFKFMVGKKINPDKNSPELCLYVDLGYASRPLVWDVPTIAEITGFLISDLYDMSKQKPYDVTDKIPEYTIQKRSPKSGKGYYVCASVDLGYTVKYLSFDIALIAEMSKMYPRELKDMEIGDVITVKVGGAGDAGI